MSRKKDLERHIRESNNLIREYENIVQDSSDPKEKARSRRAIEEQWQLIKGYWSEYQHLMGDTIPTDIAEITARFGARPTQVSEDSPEAQTTSSGGKTYITHIGTAHGIAIGDGARVITDKDES